MAFNIKDPEAVRLAAEVAAITGETKTSAIRVALEERHRGLARGTRKPGRSERLQGFLEREAWPQLADADDGPPTSKAERERILGYGADGY